MTEWTPGPWQCEQSTDPRLGGEWRIDTDDVYIADVMGPGDSGVEAAESAANARLIVRAPRMAALLQRLVDRAEDGAAVWVGDVLDEARALLRELEEKP